MKGNTIVIKHGTDGESPVIGVEEFEDIFYWTQKIGDNSPSWILDSERNKVQATGVNGTTPVIGVNKNGNWTVDYGEGVQEIKVMVSLFLLGVKMGSTDILRLEV